MWSSYLETMTAGDLISIKREPLDTSFSSCPENDAQTEKHLTEVTMAASDSICIKTEPYDITSSVLPSNHGNQDESVAYEHPEVTMAASDSICIKTEPYNITSSILPSNHGNKDESVAYEHLEVTMAASDPICIKTEPYNITSSVSSSNHGNKDEPVAYKHPEMVPRTRRGGNPCIVPGCSHNSLRNREVSWHCFPKEDSTRELWIQTLIQDTVLPESWRPKRSYKLCGAHFNSSGKRQYMDKVPRYLRPGTFLQSVTGGGPYYGPSSLLDISMEVTIETSFEDDMLEPPLEADPDTSVDHQTHDVACNTEHGGAAARGVSLIKREPQDSFSTPSSCSDSSDPQLEDNRARLLHHGYVVSVNDDLPEVKSDVSVSTLFIEQSQMQELHSGDPSSQAAKARPVKHSCELSSDTHLKRHQHAYTAEKPYKCELCPAKFTLSSSLKRHVRTHTGEKPYKCEMCPADFTRHLELKHHVRTHTGEKPYKCKLCSAKFGHSSHLKDHLRMHTGEKPYICELCPAKFTRSAYLKCHVRTHSGEKPYKCEICPAKFGQPSHLTSHLRIHTGEKPYKCELCPARFTHSAYLKGHVRTHTGEKPHQCELCSAQFIRPGSLKEHIQTHGREAVQV